VSWQVREEVVVTEWFIQTDDEQDDLGPFPPGELLEMVRSGEVTRETMLRKDDESAWFTARDVGGLFEAAMRPTIAYLCPECETEVGEPPVECHQCGHMVRQAVTTITENTIINRADQAESGGSPAKLRPLKKRVTKNNDHDVP